MLSDGSRTFTWEHGRQLKTLAYGGTTWNFTYATNGLRTGRTGGSTTYGYVYNGSQMSQMTVGSNTLKFTYANGSPVSVTYNGTIYYYVTNLQGDITAILNTSGTAVVNYTYDAWGNILSTTGSMASTLGVHNPLRYRGYVYDQEYGLYYLQSRYYNPAMGRFISADTFVSTGQGLLGNNMFVYCLNNPVRFVDYSGKEAEVVEWWTGTMWWLCYADGVLPVGDFIYGFGAILLLVATLSSFNDESVPKASTESGYGTAPTPPSPNNDDDDDDYYDDDSNYGGRERMGRSNGKAPRNNQAQNKQFDKVAKRNGLTPAQKDVLHNKITKQGFDFWELDEFAKELFPQK